MSPVLSPAPILHGDLIREIDGVLTVNLGATILVASATTPGDWHTVLPLDGKCSCRGFEYRGTCRHLRIAVEAMDYDRETAKPVPPKPVPPEMYQSTCPPNKEAWLPDPTCLCGNPWTIRIGGEVYCGECSPNVRECEACGDMKFVGRVSTPGFGPMTLCAGCSGRDGQSFRFETAP